MENIQKILAMHRLFVLMYKLIPSAEGPDGLSIGFARSREKRQQDLTENKIIKGKHLVRVMLRDILSFGDCQEKLHMI